MRSSVPKKTSALVLVTLCLFAPAAALASAGDDQYCDPFSGCPSSKPRNNSSGKAIADTSSQQQIAESIQAETLNRLAAQKARSRAAAKAYREAAKRHSAEKVLDAAGLSSIKPLLPAHLDGGE